MNGLPWGEQLGDLAGTAPFRVSGPLSWFQVLETVAVGSRWALCGQTAAFVLEGGRTFALACPVDSVELYGDGSNQTQPVTVRFGQGRAPSDLGPVRINARHKYLGRRAQTCPAQVSATEPSLTGSPYPGWTGPLGVPGTIGPTVDVPRGVVAVAASSQVGKPFTLMIATQDTQLGFGDPVPLAAVASTAQRGGRHAAAACIECLPSGVQVYVANPGATTNPVEVAAWLTY
jgi:hypothetical protein